MPVKQKTLYTPFVSTRKIYNSSGVLTSTLVTSHKVPNAMFGPDERTFWRSWTNTPNYKTLRKTQGYLPTQAMSETRLDVKGSLWSGSILDPYTQSRYEFTNLPVRVPQSVNWAETGGEAGVLSREQLLLNEAKYKVLGKARDLRANLPVAIYEGRKTVRMITEIAETLGKAYGAFRKGNFKRACKTLRIDKPFVTDKIFANNWLAYQYGWRPLVSDAVGGATMLYDLLEKSGKQKPRRMVSKVIEWLDVEGERDSGYCYSDPDWYNLYTWKRDIVARAGLLLELESSVAASASQLGVGLWDPINTAWELVPFSFVFDWFVDVGGWLEARSSLQGLSVKAGYASTLTAYQGQSETLYWKGSRTRAEPSIPPWNWQVRSYKRQHWNGFISTLRMPLWDSLNGNRLTTAASLWLQRLSGDRNPKDRYPVRGRKR